MTTEGHQQPMPQTLAELRKAAGLSQSAVAKRMGVNQPRVSQIEKDFPNLHYLVVASYMRAITDGQGTFVTVTGQPIALDEIRPDDRPTDPDAASRRRQRQREGTAKMNSAAAKELPLEKSHAHTGGDDTGR